MQFIFDENYPVPLCKGIALLEQANHRSPIKVEVLHAIDFMGGKGATDEEIIIKASHSNAVIITHDGDFRRIKHYQPLLKHHRVSYLYFRTPKGGYHYWDMVKSFVNKWEDLKKKMKSDSFPFAYEISKTGEIKNCPF
jgi:hypothetical protein